LPVYNLIVYGGSVVAIPFDAAGRGVSILLWVVGGCLSWALLSYEALWKVAANDALDAGQYSWWGYVIIKANHRVYTQKYPQLPGLSYLSGRWT
jgi:hypothetical protein